MTAHTVNGAFVNEGLPTLGTGRYAQLKWRRRGRFIGTGDEGGPLKKAPTYVHKSGDKQKNGPGLSSPNESTLAANTNQHKT